MLDQIQLAKTFRRDVEELKRTQQEHMSKLDINLIKSSFEELIQQQINKYYHYKHSEDDDDDEEEDCLDEEQKLIKKFDKLHEEHAGWLKRKKKNVKITAPIVERFRMLYYQVYSDQLNCPFFVYRGTLRSFTNPG